VRVGLSYDSLRLSPCSGDLLPQISRTNESLFATPQNITTQQTFCTKKYKSFDLLDWRWLQGSLELINVRLEGV